MNTISIILNHLRTIIINYSGYKLPVQSERRTKLYLFRHYFNFVAYFFGPFIWRVLRDKRSREIPVGMWKSAPARQTPTILPERAYEKKQLFKLRFTQIGFYVYSFSCFYFILFHSEALPVSCICPLRNSWKSPAHLFFMTFGS